MAETVNRANWQQYTADGQENSYYNYPATADWAVLKGPNHEIHEIMYSAAPGSNFDKAPVGSRLTDTTNGVLYIKTASSGWVVAGTQT